MVYIVRLIVICIEMSPTRVTQYAILGYPISHYGTPSSIYQRTGPPDLAQVSNHTLVSGRCTSVNLQNHLAPARSSVRRPTRQKSTRSKKLKSS